MTGGFDNPSALHRTGYLMRLLKLEHFCITATLILSNIQIGAASLEAAELKTFYHRPFHDSRDHGQHGLCCIPVSQLQRPTNRSRVTLKL